MDKKSSERSKILAAAKDDERGFKVFIAASLISLALLSLYAGLQF